MGVQPSLVILSPAITAQLRFLAAKGTPYEVGGLILMDDKVIQYDNVHDDPLHHFDMEADLRDDILAAWHTHPIGPECVSDEDVLCMAHLHRHGLRFPWVIVSPLTITRWSYDSAAA